MTIPARYIGGKKVHRTTTFIIDVDRYLLQLQIPWISWHLRLLTRPPTVDMRGPGERHRGLPKGGRGTYCTIKPPSTIGMSWFLVAAVIIWTGYQYEKPKK